MPIGNATGKHILTIEGIKLEELTAVQSAFAEEGATQCGFCTPGFVVSLTGYCLSGQQSADKAIEWMNGNICRCTGYKSIERAAQSVAEIIRQRENESVLDFAVSRNILPYYIKLIPQNLKEWMKEPAVTTDAGYEFLIGGGTDLYVQKHDIINEARVAFVDRTQVHEPVMLKGNNVEIAGSATVTALATSPVMASTFPRLQDHIKLISSTQIRNMATVAGNFTNASPIGDLSVFFLALNASLQLREGENVRTLALKDFFIGYKVLAKRPEEIIEKIIFSLPGENCRFSFEKVSKRTHLDIASVNSAISLVMNEQDITAASLSAGGVAPVPLYLKKTSDFLLGKKISAQLILDAIQVAMTEVAPISDARGSERYKRLLLAQLIKAHFINCFPDLPLQKLLSA